MKRAEAGTVQLL